MQPPLYSGHVAIPYDTRFSLLFAGSFHCFSVFLAHFSNFKFCQSRTERFFSNNRSIPVTLFMHTYNNRVSHVPSMKILYAYIHTVVTGLDNLLKKKSSVRPERANDSVQELS